MNEIWNTLFNDTLAIEMVTLISIVLIFVVGALLNKLLIKFGLTSYTNVIKSLCSILTKKLSKPINEKDKDFQEVNKELQDTLNKDLIKNQESTDGKSN